VENEKLFDVNDLPEAKRNERNLEHKEGMHKEIYCLRDSFIVPM